MKKEMIPMGRKRGTSMLMPTIIMAVLAVGLTFLAYQKGVHLQGLKISGNMLWGMLPLFVFALIIAGMVQQLVPKELISHWVGAESGFRGILIGTFLGSIAPGGPFVCMPLAAGLLRSGANVGTVVAFLTSWSLIAVTRLPLEFGILGWKVTFIRLACVFFFPPIAGFLANRLFGNINIIT
ncbi:permease [Chloroflexota bacterium]